MGIHNQFILSTLDEVDGILLESLLPSSGAGQVESVANRIEQLSIASSRRELKSLSIILGLLAHNLRKERLQGDEGFLVKYISQLAHYTQMAEPEPVSE